MTHNEQLARVAAMCRPLTKTAAGLPSPPPAATGGPVFHSVPGTSGGKVTGAAAPIKPLVNPVPTVTPPSATAAPATATGQTATPQLQTSQMNFAAPAQPLGGTAIGNVTIPNAGAKPGAGVKAQVAAPPTPSTAPPTGGNTMKTATTQQRIGDAVNNLLASVADSKATIMGSVATPLYRPDTERDTSANYLANTPPSIVKLSHTFATLPASDFVNWLYTKQASLQWDALTYPVITALEGVAAATGLSKVAALQAVPELRCVLINQLLDKES